MSSPRITGDSAHPREDAARLVMKRSTLHLKLKDHGCSRPGGVLAGRASDTEFCPTINGTGPSGWSTRAYDCTQTSECRRNPKGKVSACSHERDILGLVPGHRTIPRLSEK